MSVMKGSIPLELIKEKAKIEDFVSQYTDIKPTGKNYKALCPFHDDEKTLSLSIVTKGKFKGKWTEGFFYCFGCGVGGDVIKFMQLAENIEFKEACKLVAEETGIKYEERKISPEEKKCLNTIRDRNIRYSDALLENETILESLYNRGLDDEDIKKWRLGYVPQEEIKNRPNEPWVLERICYPLLEGNGDKAYAIAMGYRTTKQNDNNKFVFDKTDDTPTFNGKNKFLYGLNYARQSIREKGYAIIVEGYMDVISMHKTGLSNTVASCGTSLSPEQRGILKKLTDKLYFYYDGDKAGLSKMKEILPDLISDGFEVFIIKGDNKDPDEMCLKYNHSFQKMTKYLANNSIQGIKVLIDEVADKYETAVFKHRVLAINKLTPILDKIQDESTKTMYQSIVNKRLDI